MFDTAPMSRSTTNTTKSETDGGGEPMRLDHYAVEQVEADSPNGTRQEKPKGGDSLSERCRRIRFRKPARFVMVALGVGAGVFAAACPSLQPSTRAVASDRHPYSASSAAVAWGSPVYIDSSPNAPLSISCPTAYFCAAIDAGGNAFTFDGHHWKTYKDVDSSSGGLESVSCGSPKSCWAADGQGFFLHFDGRRWSAPAIEDPPRSGGYSNVAITVSCPTASFCLAVDINGAALVWQHGKWSRRFPQGVDTFETVTCTTSLLCMAGELSGSALSWYRGKWSKTRTISAGNGISALSCYRTTFCVAGTESGAVSEWHGRAWSYPQTVATNGVSIAGVACFSAANCLSVDGYGETFTWTGSRWTKSARLAPGNQSYVSPTSLICAGRMFCAAPAPAGQQLDTDVYFLAPVPAVATASLKTATLHRTYRQQIVARFGTSPYAWHVASGRLPHGLKLTRSGVIQGKATKAGTFTVTLAASDPMGQAGRREFRLVVRK